MKRRHIDDNVRWCIGCWLDRFFDWLDRRHHVGPFHDSPSEMCEACNHPTDDPHTITETFDGDQPGTGTEMTAVYCPEHCPSHWCDHALAHQ